MTKIRKKRVYLGVKSCSLLSKNPSFLLSPSFPEPNLFASLFLFWGFILKESLESNNWDFHFKSMYCSTSSGIAVVSES